MSRKCPMCGSYKFYEGIFTTRKEPIVFVMKYSPEKSGEIKEQIVKIKAYGCGKCGYVETSLDFKE